VTGESSTNKNRSAQALDTLCPELEFTPTAAGGVFVERIDVASREQLSCRSRRSAPS